MSWLFNQPIAHRGLHSKEVPENSLLAFGEAIINNYPIELDIRLSKDSIPFVFHDEDLKRMCSNPKNLSDLSLVEIKEYFLNDSSQKIPTLYEVLDFVRGRVPLLIEIKSEEYTGELEDKVLDLLSNYRGDFAIQSFNPLSLLHLRLKGEGLKLGLLLGDFKSSSLKVWKKVLLETMAFAPLIRPDFLAVEKNKVSFYVEKFKRVFGDPPIITWTIVSKNEVEDYNYIFENFNP